jgi:Skp family chaperone for outer membrane proteins
MIRGLFLSVLFFQVFPLTNLYAEVAAPKVGYVNFDVAFAQELEAQKYIKELETEDSKIREDGQSARVRIEAKLKILQSEVEKFQGTMSKLSPESLQKKQEHLQKQQATIAQEANKMEEALNMRRQELEKRRHLVQGELENKNRLLLESISRKENYDMVLNAAALVYVSDGIKKNDITMKLISEYNKAYPVKPEPKATKKSGTDGAKSEPKKK